uniref:Uncharacterized protein n=1 Tax=Siphoviridae sp. ctP0x5 TaxID=2827863 RepID=A0A8S5TG09_9CAUD|nr:MAG TPA: hypothetical protein [Siphoviridae sp. ctP0x5]DAG16551.1 MAG TPA: hypothetical protein [Caudoviricetes sp.]
MIFNYSPFPISTIRDFYHPFFLFIIRGIKELNLTRLAFL